MLIRSTLSSIFICLPRSLSINILPSLDSSPSAITFMCSALIFGFSEASSPPKRTAPRTSPKNMSCTNNLG
uniref:Uncharacterized protein n=1 Tax=Arabidopsis thaliana TaxID=3702 RepID=Q8GYX4_ARATH|nr:unknown protein [Arabidopsis thaliana]